MEKEDGEGLVAAVEGTFSNDSSRLSPSLSPSLSPELWRTAPVLELLAPSLSDNETEWKEDAELAWACSPARRAVGVERGGYVCCSMVRLSEG